MKEKEVARPRIRRATYLSEKSEWRSQRVGIGDERRHEIGTVDGDHFVGWSLTGWPVLAN